MRAQHLKSIAFLVSITAILASASPAKAGDDPTRPGPASEGEGIIVPEGAQVFHTSDSQFDPGIDNEGWWSDTIHNEDYIDNYLMGWTAGGDHRNFFTFDVSLLQGMAVSASLVLTCYQWASPRPSEIYALSRVSTPPDVLNQNFGPDAAIYTDLGDGIFYGARRITLARDCPDSSALLVLPLNDAAVADINAATQWFSIGGRLVRVLGGTDQYLFGYSSGQGIQALVVRTG